MRRRSFTGPLMLVVIGGLFLWSNIHPEFHVWDMVSQYWPFLLIAWGLGRLIEAVWPGDEGWRGSFSGGEVLLIVLICLVGMGMWAGTRNGFHWNSGGLEVFGNEYDYPIDAKTPAAGKMRLVVDNPRGSLKITGADTTDVTVSGQKTVRAYSREDADRTNGKTPVEIVVEGDHLLIRTNQDHSPDNQRLSDDLEVTVPRAFAVEAHGRRNDYEISDVKGNVELSSDKGDVRLERVDGAARLSVNRSDLVRAVDLKGNLDLEGQGSNIELENIGGQVTITGTYTGTLDFKNLARPLQFEGARNTELRVQAIPGHISMDLSQFDATGLVGPVRLVSRSRDVKIAAFTQSLDLENEHGDVELTPSLPVPAIEVRSDSGNITLDIPEHATFQLDATSERGDAVNGYGPPIEQKTEGRRNSLTGKVGVGPTIRLAVTRGSVEVRKQEGAPLEAPVAPAPPASPLTPDKAGAPKSLKDSEVKL